MGEWTVASPEQKAASALLWTQRLVNAGIVSSDPVTFAADIVTCVDNTLRGAAEILGPDASAREIGANCAFILNEQP